MNGPMLKVVLDAEYLDDGSVRVHFMGAFRDGYRAHPDPPAAGHTRAIVQTWLDTPHDVHAMRIWPDREVPK